MQIFQEVLTLIGICWLKVLFNLSLSDSNDVAVQNSIYSSVYERHFFLAPLHLFITILISQSNWFIFCIENMLCSWYSSHCDRFTGFLRRFLLSFTGLYKNIQYRKVLAVVWWPETTEKKDSEAHKKITWVKHFSTLRQVAEETTNETEGYHLIL